MCIKIRVNLISLVVKSHRGTHYIFIVHIICTNILCIYIYISKTQGLNV